MAYAYGNVCELPYGGDRDPEFMNRSVIFAMVLKSVSFGSVSRRMTIIMFFIMYYVVYNDTGGAHAIRGYCETIPGTCRSFCHVQRKCFFPDLFMMPVFSAIRPGSTR